MSVSLGIQHAMRMRRIILPCWPFRLYNIFPHYLINGTIFEKKKVIEYKMCVLIFSTTLVWNLFILIIIDRDMINDLHVKYPLFLSDLNVTWILQIDFQKILKYQISWKSVRWELRCSMRTYRRTDMTNKIIDFRNFANAPNMPHLFQIPIHSKL